MKSNTDIEQARTLAEFLPHESADQTWERIPVALEQRYRHNGNTPFFIYCGIGFPCWSLAALFSLLPSFIIRKGKRMFLTMEKAGAFNLYYKSPDRLDELWETKEELVDACYEMILTLHEQKLFNYEIAK